MAVLNGLQHFVFGGMLRACFHHDDAFFGSRDHDVDLGLARFVVAGVRYQLAFTRPTRTPPSTCWNGMSEIASAAPAPTMASVLGIAFRIGRKHHGDDLRLVHEAFREQRPDRPVDQTAGEDLLLRRTPFALDEAAGKLARGISIFTIIDGEREERGARFGLFIGASAHQNHGIPGADHDGAIGLFRDFACLQGNFLTIQVNFYGM